jgi:arabinogalactan oligomer / maltooligosaccharide transport system permease protein
MIEPQSQGIGQAIPVPQAALREESRGLAGLRVKRKKKNLRTGEITFLWISRLIVVAFALLILIPAAWVVGSSFQPGQYFSPTLLPTGFTLQHYQDLFSQTNFFLWVRNSVFVCTLVGVVTVLLVSTMAYAFSRFKFRGRKYGLMGLLLIQMFPAQMSFVAFYFLLNKFNLLDNLTSLGLVLIGGGLPFNAWLFKGYIDSLPKDLEEAAYVDGASKFQAYWRIILPLCRPMMAVIFLFTWFGMYSEFLVTSFLINNPNNYTIALGLHGYIQNNFTANWTVFSAGAILGTVPLMLVFLGAQRFLVSGLARGAVKG